MSNGEVCCILGVCCPPEERRERAVTQIANETGTTATDAGVVFDWFDSRFDFAPKGMLQPLIDRIAEDARTHPEKV
jgi:hypothetical protein